MSNISFSYPQWYIILCILLGVGYAVILYTRAGTFKEYKWLHWVLGVARAVLVTLLAMLLLSPQIKSLLTETKKPIIVLAQDNSESILANMSEQEVSEYKENFQNLQQNLEQDYQVQTYSFGSEVREKMDFTFTDKVSNVSEMLNTVYDQYSNQNLGAMILATDGIYNEGSNPIYAGTKLAAPIYTVALGDTTPQKDVYIKRVFHNKIAYLGDKFSIQVDIASQNCAGSNTSLVVKKVGGGAAQTFPIKIDKNNYFTTKEVILNADQSGVQRYLVSVNKLDGEVSTVNNNKEIFIDVLDARQKILILADSPHPDLSAIKSSMEKNKNYEVEIKDATSTSINIPAYDFVILHQLPSVKYPINTVLSAIKNNKKPTLFVVGSQSDINKFNGSQSLLQITGSTSNTNDVQATFASNFSLYKIDAMLENALPKFSPLSAPFGEYKEGPNTSVLAYQKIGKVDTKYPLILFGENNGAKSGVIAAENIWKWKLFDFLENKNHNVFEELLSKCIQYLSLKEDKRKFRVSLDKNIFNENEQLIFDAELYNQSYELINEPDASISIKDEQGKEYNFTFDKSGNAYRLNVGLLNVGNYKYTAKTFTNGENLTYNGQFSVRPIQLELFETTADHSLLKLLSDKYGGSMVSPTSITSLSQVIKDKGNAKPVIYESTKTRSIINIRWILALLIGLLVFEWFMRRYFGSY